MGRRVCLLMVLVACGDNASTTIDARTGDDAAVDDAATDASIDAPIDAPPGPYLAVASDDQILFFSPTDSGNTAPHHVLGGPATKLDAPRALATAGGELFVLNGQSITVYPYTASGNTAPLRTITGPGFTSHPRHELAVANDEIYVLGSRVGSAVISMFPADANGDVAPIREITNVFLSGAEPSALAVSATEIFVGSLEGVTVYPVGGTGTINATRGISGTPPFSRASSIVFEGTEMFIARENFLYALPASAVGSVTQRTITGGLTGLPFDDGEIDVHDGAIYVTINNASKVLAFPATGSGNLQPIRAIYGETTMLGNVRSLVVVP